MITIIDYGVGNVQAFLNLYHRLNIRAKAALTADQLRGATKLILPGVGHFDHAMRRLEASGMRGPLEELVLEKAVPLLGVCVGMQMLARSSDEGELDGLGWIDGHVRAFNASEHGATLPVPHMGWNDVQPLTRNGLFQYLTADARFYFLHSYFVDCAREHILAQSTYGFDFACAIHAGAIYGVQFHPEKSHRFGTQLLKNFAEL